MGCFLPTGVRSERRGVGPGWEARARQRSSTAESTKEVIRFRTRVRRLPDGIPWGSLRAPCLGARRTNLGKMRKRRNVSQEGLSKRRARTLASASAHCVRQPRGTWRRPGRGVGGWRPGREDGPGVGRPEGSAGVGRGLRQAGPGLPMEVGAGPWTPAGRGACVRLARGASRRCLGKGGPEHLDGRKRRIATRPARLVLSDRGCGGCGGGRC